jgi:glycosyltransferase involved in cell wall biosynthesis
MKICLVGLDTLPVLAREYGQYAVGGESVQQGLLALRLARRGHEVSAVVADYGQADGAKWGGIRTYKAYKLDAGLPVLRFIHPRWTGLWSALERADADIYYTSCAGVHVGLLALFCGRFEKRFVFRTASDADCDPSKLLVRFARDRWLYSYGLRRADAILVQTASQARTLERNYGLAGRVAGMLVDEPAPAATRDIDVLWVANIWRPKRPDRAIAIADELKEREVHMVGGRMPREDAMFEDLGRAAAARANLKFHGRLPYRETNELYARAKTLVNTSDIEGFPNVYLQAWIAGVPVVALFDPDGVIAREGLGTVAASPEGLVDAVRQLLDDPDEWREASDRCRAFMLREYGEEKQLATYLDTFEQLGSPKARRAAQIPRTSLSRIN